MLQVANKVVFALAGFSVDGQDQFAAGLDFTGERENRLSRSKLSSVSDVRVN